MVVRICPRQLKIACNSPVYEEVGFLWRSVTVVSPIDSSHFVLHLSFLSLPVISQQLKSVTL